MSYLKKLLAGAEVEWKPLGKVCRVFNGYAFQSDLFNSEKNGLPLIRIRDINTGFSETYFSGVYDERFLVFDEDILIGMDGDFRAIKWKNGKALLNQRVCRLQDFKSEIFPDFIFYIVQDELIRIHNKIQSSTVKHLSSRELERSLIPVPPISVQKEIVRILDTLTKLTAEITVELTAELTARQKQYEYYREELLSFNKTKGGGVKHLNMSELGVFIRGGGLQKKDFTATGIGCIHYGQIYTHYGTFTNRTKTFVSEEFAKKARKAKHGDLVIATTSENDEDVCKAVAWLGNEEIAISSDACFYVHNLNPKYVAYFFQTEQFQKQKRPFITGTKVRRVNAKDLAKIKIPVPSPEEQARIVSILDKFDILTNSISEGLPMEIELRKKQYEYYRNMLLTFPQQESA